MEHEKPNFAHKDGFVFAGAIFMSNRATKRECLQRKLFGLPHSKAKFLKQVKAGMILFLFEHEERKLFGVFEATSDGAFNIIPDAFRSTGQSYPAQILFKRILVCRPLVEDEFRSAIGENYYSPNKFHFGLSYEQVTNLIRLFYSRKTNLDQNSAVNRVRLTETYVKCESDEYASEGKSETKRHYSLPQSSMDIVMHHSTHATGTQHTVADAERVKFRTVEAQPSYPPHFYPETVDSQRSCIFLPDGHVTVRQFHIGNQRPPTAETVYHKPLSTTNLVDMAMPYDPDAPEFSPPCSNNNMIRRIAEIQEPDMFKSLHVVSAECPQTGKLLHSSVYGAQRNQLFDYPDYIPLLDEPQQKPVDSENQNSIIRSYEYVSSPSFSSCIPSTCKTIPYDDDGPNPYRRMETDDYPVVVVDDRLHSDSSSCRPSVFSRLSRGQVAHETPEPCSGLSLEQLFNMLASRRERWSIRNVSEELMEWGSNEQHDCELLTELFDQSSKRQNKFTQSAVQPVEGSSNEQNNGIAETENAGCITPFEYGPSGDVAERSFELPFYNFRRRNTNQKCEARDDPIACSNTCGGEATVARSKRRRILRPSLNQEELNGKGQAEMKEETEVKTTAQPISDHKDDSRANDRLESQAEMKEETEAKTTARPISELEDDNHANDLDSNIPVDETRLESNLEGEPEHATSIDGWEDYIPIG